MDYWRFQADVNKEMLLLGEFINNNFRYILCFFRWIRHLAITVPHERLLCKTEGYGIKHHILCWLRAFLVGRKQRVSVNGQTSEWSEVTSSIPQGSVLGLLLFVIFINDLPSHIIRALIRIFANYTKSYMEVTSIQECEEVQDGLLKADSWSDQRQIRLNRGKCKVKHLGYNNMNYEYYMSDVDKSNAAGNRSWKRPRYDDRQTVELPWAYVCSHEKSKFCSGNIKENLLMHGRQYDKKNCLLVSFDLS